MNNYQVLLVDDEELALEGIENGIQWDDLKVGTIYKANGMRQAIEIMQDNPIDLMISDIEMPGGNGIELIKWVAETKPHIISVFYTCHAEFNYCQEALKLGAIDYVLKPIPYIELEEILKKGILKLQQGREVDDLRHIWGELVKTKEKHSPVENVKKMITENISVEICRDELAKSVYMSPDYLTKLFKKETGVSLSEYIIEKRIALAEQLLDATKLSIVEIAQKTGFSYSSYFVKIFKKKRGITPQQYREKNKNN